MGMPQRQAILVLITSLELALSAVWDYISALVSPLLHLHEADKGSCSLWIILPWLLVAEQTLHFIHFEAWNKAAQSYAELLRALGCTTESPSCSCLQSSWAEQRVQQQHCLWVRWVSTYTLCLHHSHWASSSFAENETTEGKLNSLPFEQRSVNKWGELACIHCAHVFELT